MDKKLIYSLVLAFFAVAMNVCTLFAAVDDPNGTDDKPSILCRCQKGWFTNSDCLASNSGNLCAQSEPDGNIICGEYNSNCK